MPPEELPDERILGLLDRQLGRYQEIVSRLAGSSAQVKTWCATVLAALVAVAVGGRRPVLLLVGAVLLVAFAFLDAYYLSLERGFRSSSERLVQRVAAGGLDDWTALLAVEVPEGGARWRTVAGCASSLAIWPFYTAIAVFLAAGAVVA